MASFSGEKALASGFRVIGRNPAAVVVWAVVYLVVGLGPGLLMMGPMLSHPAGYNPADPQAAFAALSRMMVWVPFLWLFAIAYMSLAYGAVYRAVLTPEDRQYFYLRLSRQELWLGLTLLVLVVLFVVCVLIAAIAIGILSRTAPGLVTFLACVGAVAGAIWLALRFSMATPMAFAERRFILMESWRLTEGQGWRLFGVAFCLFVILIALEIAILLPTMLVLSLTGVFKTMMSTAATGAAPAYPLPAIVAYLVIFPIFAALMYAIIGAPWASIYQQLTSPQPDAAP